MQASSLHGPETVTQKIERWERSLTPELRRDYLDANGNPYVRFLGFQESDHPILQPGYIGPAINSAGESIDLGAP